MNKGPTIRTGQTQVQRWADDLLRRIEEGAIDPDPHGGGAESMRFEPI